MVRSMLESVRASDSDPRRPVRSREIPWRQIHHLKTCSKQFKAVQNLQKMESQVVRQVQCFSSREHLGSLGTCLRAARPEAQLP